MMLNRYRDELGVTALTQELDATARHAIETLETESATLRIDRAGLNAGALTAVVAVENLAGHKLPSAYPSRRAWLHVTVRDGSGRTVFESGAFQPNGSIGGNDNDADATKFEPHYPRSARPTRCRSTSPSWSISRGPSRPACCTGSAT